MSEDKMHAEFEAWWRSRHGESPGARYEHGYCEPGADEAWSAWIFLHEREARAERVVEAARAWERSHWRGYAATPMALTAYHALVDAVRAYDKDAAPRPDAAPARGVEEAEVNDWQVRLRAEAERRRAAKATPEGAARLRTDDEIENVARHGGMGEDVSNALRALAAELRATDRERGGGRG